MDRRDVFDFLKKNKPTRFTSDDLAIIFERNEDYIRRTMSLISGDKKLFEIKRQTKTRETRTGPRLVYQYYYEDEDKPESS